MELAVFNQVVLPLVEMRNSLLVCISTPLGPDNFYSALMDLQDPETGEYVFYRIRVISLCEECQKKSADFCPHLGPVDVPEWKASSTDKKARHVQLMYGTDTEARMLETKGLAVASSTSALDRSNLHTLFNESPRAGIRELDNHIGPSNVLVCCDPNGGGTSHLAIAAVYREPWSKRIVVRLAHTHTKQQRGRGDMLCPARRLSPANDVVPPRLAA